MLLAEWTLVEPWRHPVQQILFGFYSVLSRPPRCTPRKGTPPGVTCSRWGRVSCRWTVQNNTGICLCTPGRQVPRGCNTQIPFCRAYGQYKQSCTLVSHQFHIRTRPSIQIHLHGKSGKIVNEERNGSAEVNFKQELVSNKKENFCSSSIPVQTILVCSCWNKFFRFYDSAEVNFNQEERKFWFWFEQYYSVLVRTIFFDPNGSAQVNFNQESVSNNKENFGSSSISVQTNFFRS